VLLLLVFENLSSKTYFFVIYELGYGFNCNYVYFGYLLVLMGELVVLETRIVLNVMFII
jgi:hypothetical protein